MPPDGARTSACTLPAIRFPVATLPHQRGVVLILIVLLLVVASSYLLLTQLNAAASESYRRERSAVALERARQALIGYAATYPDNPATSDALAGPGYLPCPDTDNDGSPNPPCGTLAAAVRIGRLPWEFLGLDDVRDSSGERLWYAVSGNFRNNPKTLPLNSETPAQLTIDGSADIVAMVFAPGPSFNGQARPSNAAADYLEGENNDGNAIFVSNASGDFNDQILVINRRDFMRDMEKRVLGEAANAVSQFREVTENLTPALPNDGRYPWLSPFAAPRAATLAAPMISGTATAGGPTTLTDTARDFVALGVRVDDIVQNVTDGSKGVVAVGGVTATTLTLVSLRDGTDNQFQLGDVYQIPRNNSDIVSGTAREGHLPFHATVAPPATAGEALRTAFALDWDIREANGATVTSVFLPAVPPSVVTPVVSYVPGLRLTVQETLPRPLLDSVAVPAVRDPVPVLVANGICVWSVTGYPVNFPTAGSCPGTQTATDDVDCSGMATEVYFTRTATAGSAGATLADAEVDFLGLGVNLGDVVENQANATSGFVTAVAATSLTAPGLTISAGDAYRVRIATRELPLPPPGTATLLSIGPLLEDTNVDFLVLGVNPGDYVENLTTGLKGVVQTVGVPTASHLTVDPLSGVIFTAGDQYQLTNAATGGTAGFTLVDSSQDFVLLNARIGDVVRNVTDGSIGRVSSVAANQLTVTALSGGASNSFNVGDEYLVRSGVIENRQYDFRPIIVDAPGSVASFANSGGTKVRSVAIGTLAAPAALPQQPPAGMPVIPPITITDLDLAGTQLGSATLSIPDGTPGFVSTSNVHMDLAPLDGTTTAAGGGGIDLIDSTRDFATLGVRPGDWVEKLGAGCAKGRVESVGSSPPGNQVRVKNVPGNTITFAAGDAYRIYHDLPPWFWRNNWHQLIYAAASPQEVPTGGSTGLCNIGTDCLVLNDLVLNHPVLPNGPVLATNNDQIRALVIAAGVDSVTGSPRTSGLPGAYYEGQNNLPIMPPLAGATCPGDRCIFERDDFSPSLNTFNDEVRIIARRPP